MASLARLRDAERAVEDARRTRDAAAVDETRIALSIDAATADARPALRAELPAASARLHAAGMAHERALRTLFALLAESPAEEHEPGDPLAGLTTRVDPLGRAYSARHSA